MISRNRGQILQLLMCSLLAHSSVQAHDWQHSGALYILTTPEGANLPAGAVEQDFPLLVRIDKDFFDFSEAQPQGQDIRFTSGSGQPLSYQIEQWDPAGGRASIWVRIPEIRGNAQQEIRLRWGNPDASSESDGKAVFNESNGYLTVLHMGDPVNDAVGSVKIDGAATAPADGIIGAARSFIRSNKGIGFAEKMEAASVLGDAPRSVELWFKTPQANAHWAFWGGPGGVLRLQSKAAKIGESKVPLNEWTHLVKTYGDGAEKLYVNGRLDGIEKTRMKNKDSRHFVVGGWGWGSFVGQMDELRLSNVERSADWVRLQVENQKTMQTVVGPLVQTGNTFSVSPKRVDVKEGATVTVKAEAGGARKLYWIEKRGSEEQVVAADLFAYTLDAGRVAADTGYTLELRAVYADGVKRVDIPVRVTEAIPDPSFTLRAPRHWDGRETIAVVPQITTLDALRKAGADVLRYTWDTGLDIAVVKDVADDKLLLRRAMNSGALTVTASIDNGGESVSVSTTIEVREPSRNAWVPRQPGKAEMPQNNQFYARDDANEGMLYCTGTLDADADSVFLWVYAGDTLYQEVLGNVSGDREYALAAKLKPGLVTYKVEFGSVSGGKETVLHTATNVVCGDAFLIQGQSNAVADNGQDFKQVRDTFDTYISNWVRTYGWSLGRGNAEEKEWGNARISAPRGRLQIGYWGLMLARQIVEEQKVPVLFINGARGGTRIDQHQRPETLREDEFNTIYGRVMWRLRHAHLTHGIRAVIWHQGEADQGTDHPSGAHGSTYYREQFLQLAGDWQRDMPNIRNIYVFQLWPKACRGTGDEWDDRLREEQRKLETAFSNLDVMSTLGITPSGPCHYPPAGYAAMARSIFPSMARDIYGQAHDHAVSAPNVQNVYYANARQDEIVLEFDQPMVWDDALLSEFYPGGEAGQVASGRADGNRIVLKLNGASTAHDITYLKSKSWSQGRLLYGKNGIAALTFCEVPITAASEREVED